MLETGNATSVPSVTPGLVSAEKRGKEVYYRINATALQKCCGEGDDDQQRRDGPAGDRQENGAMEKPGAALEPRQVILEVGARMAFIRPKSTHGVLIELDEEIQKYASLPEQIQ